MTGSNRVNVIALRRIGRYAEGETIKNVDKYCARVLVAVGKAKFENEEDEFRKVAPPKRRRYQRRDMVPE